MHFNTKTVSKITGLTKRQIDHWDKTHFIKPSVQEASGTGSVRLYSFNDLIQLKVAKSLIEKGITLQKIRKAITFLKKHVAEITKPLSQLKFLTDGSTIFTLARDKKTIIDTLQNGQVVISVALGLVIEELESEVIKIDKERKYSVTVKGKKYDVIIHADTEDGGYWVECPELACNSQGDTVEESLEMIKDSVLGHLEILEERNLKQVKKAL